MMGSRRRIKLDFLAAVLIVSVCLVHAQEEVSVLIEPENPDLSKPAGLALALTCQGNAEKPELFRDMKWMGPDGNEVTQDDSKPIYTSMADPGKLYLVFSNPTPEASGKYICTAIYGNTLQREDSVQIAFYHPITWEDCKEQQAIVVGTDGKIRCTVNANPAPFVQWYKGALLQQNERLSLDGDGITIREVTSADAGVYSIRAMVQTTGDLSWKKINVEVHVPPEIIELREKYEFVVGERSEMECQATGYPAPKYYWYHEKTGKNLSEAEGYNVNTESGALTIHSVRREDAGQFACKAINSAATDTKYTTVVVIVKPEVKEFRNLTTTLGTDVTMECRVSGDPTPEITIRKDGNDRAFVNGDDRIRLDRRERDGDEVLVFTIQGVLRQDDGLYYCSGKNTGGLAEQVGHITVQYPPDMTATPNTNVKTWKEHPMNITCIAEAIPNATITWTFRNREIINNELYRIYGEHSVSNLLVKPSLNVPGGNDVYGNYQCHARNQFGNNSIDISLTEAREPGRLQQQSIERNTATTVTFMLRGPKDDGGLPVREFVVEYREWDQAVTAIQTREWLEGSSYILEKLKPRTEYVFRFAAKNDAGVGGWGEELRFVMPTESTPEVPNFMIPGGTNTSRYPDSFTVRWAVPQDNGKPIDYFVLRYFEVEWESNEWHNVGKDNTIEITDWENAPRHHLLGLKPNTQYKVEIRAHNDIGFSQPASMVFKTSTGSVIEEQKLNDDSSNLTTAAIVAIIIVVVLVILGLLDATCYLRYHCGVFYCLRTAVCGRSASPEKVKDGVVEEGKGKENNETHHGPSSGKKHQEIDLATEETPMIVGGKDGKIHDASNEDLKNKSPNGSKSSIAKDSLV